MRIDLNPGLPLGEADLSRTRDPKRASGEEAAVPADLPSSSSPTSVQRLAQSVLSAPEVRMKNVEALRDTISSGQYQVSSQQIAASMLEQLARHKGGSRE